MPSLDKSVKSLVKLFKNLGIDSVGMIETNGNKEFDACVFWRVICFYCMSIKPFNGNGMFYGLFVKDFVSNGLVWVYIVQECLDLCGSPSIAYILRLFEYWHEGYLEGFVLLYYEDKNWETFYENLVKDFSSYGLGLDMKEFMNLCSHFSCDMVLSLIEHEFGDPYTVFGVVLSLRAVSGPNPYHHTLIFDLLSLYFIGVRNPDLRTNPFQEGEDDMTVGARHPGPLLRHEPLIDWGPKMRAKARRGSNKARWPPEDESKREGSDLRTNPFQEGEDDTIMEAVHQSFQPQLYSKSNQPIKMTSKRSSKTTNVFAFKRASHEYLARVNRSPVERVMADLLKPHRGEGESRETERPARPTCQVRAGRSDILPI